MPVNHHDIVWNQKTISAFWNRYSSDSAIVNQYFSRQKGAAILGVVRKKIKLDGRVVDLGCGPGYFIEHLLNAGIACSGADISSASVQELNKRLGNNPLFGGALVSQGIRDVPFAENSIDVCFFIEALEHFLPDDREIYLKNINKSLVPGGYLVVTVPYAEDLENAKVVCAFCGCRFHRIQHVASFNPTLLRQIMMQAGFESIYCRPTILWPDWKTYFSAQKSKFANRNEVFHHCPECGHDFAAHKKFFPSLVAKIKSTKLFHLVYVGRKSHACKGPVL